MKVRRLSQNGIETLIKYLESLTTDEPASYPSELLDADDDNSSELTPPVDLDARTFNSRMEAAAYLDEKFSSQSFVGIEGDKGIWAWIALFFFDQLCAKDRDGNLRPGEVARWVPDNDNYRKYYRHLLLGPLSIFRAHRDDPNRALALLCGPLREPGDVVEQLAARQELVTNRAVIQAATTLYVDSSTKKLRRGAAGRGAGSARRLADVLNQLDVTWDLYGMIVSDLVPILPKEFDRFRKLSG